ncbi:hypothetical protein [Tritonibacter mobilis]|uniref:hypothetical protein n=1 Tax=Tritonibacter mobilis TaxID=379347 RepID=UPI0039A672AA
MGFDRIANMVLRSLIGRAVNAGVNAGINAVAKRGGGKKSSRGDHPPQRAEGTPEEQAERERIRAVRQARRARRAQRDQS